MHSDLWQTADVPGIRTNLYHQDLARSNNVEYTFKLDRIVSTGEISIELKQGATSLHSFTVFDSTYTSGQFGFYNMSEGNVTYSAFTADVLNTVPEPTSFAIFGIGALGLAVGRRRRHNKDLTATA